MKVRYTPDALHPEYKTVRLEQGDEMTDQKRRLNDRFEEIRQRELEPDGQAARQGGITNESNSSDHAAPSAAAGEPAKDLHDAIMNLPCKVPQSFVSDTPARMAYKYGHRDARHAAAELALAHPAAPVQPLTDEAIDEVFNAMPGGVEGWLKQFGYRQFARSIARHTLVRVADSMAGTIRPTDDELWEQTIGERDCYHEWADKLAGAIAKHFGAEIGEHSNVNCPWAEALEVIEAAPVQPVAVPAEWQPIETAPQDGTNVILTDGKIVTAGGYINEPGSVREVRDMDGRYIDQVETEGYEGWMDMDGGIQATHWMPLPSAPGAAAPSPVPEQKGEQQAFPERDLSKPTERQGLFHKFDVRRVDGSDQPGGKHYRCRYFVLDLNHDQHAPAAMRAYAAACRATHPQLAADIVAEFGAEQQAAPEQADHDEAVTLLAAVFDAWENGDPCYEDADPSALYLGTAFRLDEGIFNRCCDLLNRKNPPRNASATPAGKAAAEPKGGA